MEAGLDAYASALAVARQRRAEDGMNPAVWPGSPEYNDDRMIAVSVAQCAVRASYGDAPAGG